LVTELVLIRGGGIDVNAALASAVQDAVKRRVLFACIINEQNEMHRSMTVNILHGQLQGSDLQIQCMHTRVHTDPEKVWKVVEFKLEISF